MCLAYVKARNALLECGALEPDSPEANSPPEDVQHQGPAARSHTSTRGRKHKPPVLPTLDEVLSHTGVAPLPFPDQRTLTRMVQKKHQRWSADALSAEGKTRTAHLSRQTIQAHSETGETATYLQEIARFDKEQQLRHSPLGFMAHTESLVEHYPPKLFAVILSYVLGLPAPSCLQLKDTRVCEACGQLLDKFGHHRMTCRQTASYQAPHRSVASAFADIAKKSGIPFTDKSIPSHLTTNKVGDALCQPSPDNRQLILDYTVVHPRLGTSNAAGQWNPLALDNAVRDKWNRHDSQYAVMGFAFAPCALTTYGHIHAHVLRLLYIFAKKRAEMVHVHDKPLCDVEYLFSFFFAQSRARLGAAVMRGMALRALGVSALGVSKVLLRCTGPAYLRDQNLFSGQHFTPGHAQWRLALDA